MSIRGFFGRKPNLYANNHHETKFEDDNDLEKVNNHLSNCESVQESASKSSKSAAGNMVLRNKRKFPPSEYEISEEVIVKNIYTGKRIKAAKIFSCVLLEKKSDRYKVKYEKNDRDEVGWFLVSQVTSKTRRIEKEKQANQQSRSYQSFKTKYHLGKR